MRWASALTQQTDPLSAGDTLAREIREQLEGASAHLLLVFAQIAQADALGAVVERLQHAHPEARVVGCTGGSVLASGSEPEGRPAVAVLAAHLPDVAVVPFRVTEVLLRQVMADPTTWHRHLDLVPEQQPVFVLLPDPFTTRADALIASLDAAYPGLAKLGGLASGGREAGEHVLVLDHETHRDGTVAVALYGDIAADTVVAQGARPVGPDFAITAASDNLIEELDGGEAATTLQGFWKTLDPIDRGRFRQAPMVGLAMGEGGTDRDYLVRDLLGVERSTGRIAVSTGVRPGMTLRFHVRDPQSAEEDLRVQLLRWKTTPTAQEATAAVLFSCLGRGEGFFGTPDHDSRLLHSIAGPLPLAGFFGNGELGPVHGTTWMHAYTTVIGLFRSRGWS